MFDNLLLFEQSEQPSFRQDLQQLLAKFAKKKIFVGASSWKYEGWLKQIYSPERYRVRGRHSRKRFADECLREYTEVFPTVCGDFAFYQFPTEQFWTRHFSAAPSPFQLSLKVPEEITTPAFPRHARYGARGGFGNTHFLDWALMEDLFLKPLERFRAQIPVLIFEFGAIVGQTLTPSDFADALSSFFAHLPNTFRYAVELRNPEILAHPDYWAALKQYQIAHVYNAWSRMPDLLEQSDSYPPSTDITVVRALLKKGRAYAEAVERFSPYREIRDPDPVTRQGIRDIIARSMHRGEAAYIYLNNRLEGNAPSTMYEILSALQS